VPAFEFDDTFVAGTRVVPVVHGPSGMPVDIMLAGPGLEELFIGSAAITTLASVSIPVIRAEHLAVMKPPGWSAARHRGRCRDRRRPRA